jgi:hypothetical protein
MQIALQGIMQFLEFLGATIDLRYVTIERDKVCRLHDLLIVKKCTGLCGVHTHLKCPINPPISLRIERLSYTQQLHDSIPSTSRGTAYSLIVSNYIKGSCFE